MTLRRRTLAALALCVGCGTIDEVLGVVNHDGGTPAQVADASGDAPFDATLAGDAADGSDASGGFDGAEGGDGGESGAVFVCDPALVFRPPQPINELESPATEGGFRLLPDELTGFFWSSRDGGPGSGNLYTTSRPDRSSPFGNVTLLDNVNAVRTFQLDPSVSANGLFLAFRSIREAGVGGDDLLSATRTSLDASFADVAFISSLDTPADEVQPFVRADGAELYFASNQTGDYDLYRAPLVAGVYGPATAVTELDVVGADDGDPVVSADDKTIFFSSTRDGGAGLSDIWTAVRADTSAPFGPASNVAVLNSPAVEDPTWLSPDGCRLYMSRQDDAGLAHIYLATRGP